MVRTLNKWNIDRNQFPGHLIKWHPYFVTSVVQSKRCVYWLRWLIVMLDLIIALPGGFIIVRGLSMFLLHCCSRSSSCNTVLAPFSAVKGFTLRCNLFCLHEYYYLDIWAESLLQAKLDGKSSGHKTLGVPVAPSHVGVAVEHCVSSRVLW